MKHYENQQRLNGKFATSSPEVASKKLTVRVPPSLRLRVERVAGESVADWLREAIVEKLNRENG